jgi:hypothetical protein
MGEASTEALKALQAEYDEYKETQTEKFNTSVSRVNAANVSRLFDSLGRAEIKLSRRRKNSSTTLANSRLSDPFSTNS